MVVDVVTAETVIPGAAGTVTKLKAGIFGVGPAAYGAFMLIQLLPLLFPDSMRRFPEVNCSAALPVRDALQQGSREEYEEVQHGDDWEQVEREAILQNGKEEIRRVNQGKIFHPDRDEKEKKNLLIGKKNGIGEKHGKVKILCSNMDPVTAEEIGEKTVYHRDQPADKKVNAETGSTPVILQRGAHPVIKIKHKKCEDTHARRIGHEGEKTPDLSAEDQRGVKAEITEQNTVGSAQNPEDHVGYGQIAHQIWNTEIGVSVTETVNYPHGIFHRTSLRRNRMPV